MISSKDFVNSVSNNEDNIESSDDGGWGSDFDEPVTERYAQEIEENRINEKREGITVLTKTGNYENIIMEETSGRNKLMDGDFVSKPPFNSEAVHKTRFSYLVSNNSPEIKQINITSPNHQHENSINSVNLNDCESTRSVANIKHSLKSTNLKQNSVVSSQTSTTKKKPGKLPPEAFNFLKKFNTAETEKTSDVDGYLKLENCETLISPPPLPARPPPLFKYPRLNFSAQTADLSSVELNIDSKTINELPDISNNIHSQSDNNGCQLRKTNNGNKSYLENTEKAQGQLKNQSVETKSEVVSQTSTKRPIPITKSLKNLLENADDNLKECPQFETIKNEPQGNVGTTKQNEKPELPKRPDKLFNQHLGQNLSNQHKTDLRFRARKSIAQMETTTTFDVPSKNIKKCDEFDVPIVDNMKNYPKSRRSLISLPDNTRLESSVTHMTNSLNENRKELQLPDFDPWQHAMDRPSLPQKLRTPQRSVSCNSLVQSFKDLSLAIWFPPEKEKRSSTTSSNIKVPRKIGKEDIITPPINLTTSPVIEETKMPEEKSLTPMEQSSITRNLWYHEVDASEAQRRLLKLELDGAFLVRPSTRPTSNIHYTVSVTRSGRVLNTHIREKKNGHYAIGKEKEDEKTFPSISELIKYYQDVPFEIRPSGSSTSYGICFRITPPR